MIYSYLGLVLGDPTGSSNRCVHPGVSRTSSHSFLGEGPPEEDGFIEPSKPREEVKQDPYPLPKEFEWASMDIDDPVQVGRFLKPTRTHSQTSIQIKEVYDLLSANYVEDGDASFRFKYSAEFFQWWVELPLRALIDYHLGLFGHRVIIKIGM